MFGEQMIRMAQALKIEVITLENKPKDKVLTHFYSESLGIIVFLVLAGLEEACVSLAFLQKCRAFL